MSLLIPCPDSVQKHASAVRNKIYDPPQVHNHACKNGPADQRPDLHVCEVCGSCFQQPMDFGELKSSRVGCPYCAVPMVMGAEAHYLGHDDCRHKARAHKLYDGPPFAEIGQF